MRAIGIVFPPPVPAESWGFFAALPLPADARSLPPAQDDTRGATRPFETYDYVTVRLPQPGPRRAQSAIVIERLARFGYASKGAVYLIAGLLTVAGAFGRGGGTSDQHDAFSWVQRQPFGRLLLVVIAVGLAGYALWRLGSGLADWEQRGSDAKGIAIRIGSFGRGVIYSAFALEVLRLVMRGGGSGESSDASAKHWTARALDAPFGRWLVAAAGIGIVAYGIGQLFSAWTSKLSKKLNTSAMSERQITISRFGIGARAVIFLIIGTSIFLAAWRHDASEAQGTTGAMRFVGSYGMVPLALIGLGLAAYGIYALMNAKYRRIQS